MLLARISCSKVIVLSAQRWWNRLVFLATCGVICSTISVGNAASPLTWLQDDTTVTVQRGDLRLLSYRFGQVPYKPYADRLTTPAGANVLRDAPPDHAHHHGLMFAVAAEGVDFWAEFPDQSPGIQRQRELDVKVATKADVDAVELRQCLDWTRADDEAILTEEREITIFDPVPLEATLLTWQSTLTVSTGRPQVTLGGSHYFGLGMRFAESMDRDARFVYEGGQPGEVVRGEERVTRGRWCVIQASAATGPVTVALFDHPANARHPATFFTMPVSFAYLSATLNLWREPLIVKAENPLVLRYGVAVWDGAASREQVESLYQRWLKLSQVGGSD